jgi:hypothetical protein
MPVHHIATTTISPHQFAILAEHLDPTWGRPLNGLCRFKGGWLLCDFGGMRVLFGYHRIQLTVD